MTRTAALDRAEITELVSRLGACLDEHRFADLVHLLDDDVSVATPGGEATGTDAVVAQAARTHQTHPHIQHVITDVLVDLDGDRASARANLIATFADAERRPTSSLGQVYHLRARRTAAGWRLDRIAVEPSWRWDRP